MPDTVNHFELQSNSSLEQVAEARPPRSRAERSRITPEAIEAIRALSPIEQVIGEHVQLRRSGIELKGCCPFHADKTPSLYISRTKAVFRCHGCGAGGDVFEFIRLLHHCSFCESVEILATRAGIQVNGFRPSPELAAKVAVLKAHYQDELAFEGFRNHRLEAINQQYRSLGRAAAYAENCLRAGEADPYVHDLAWDALKRFIDFEARIEREGLCELDVLKTEWSKLRDVA